MKPLQRNVLAAWIAGLGAVLVLALWLSDAVAGRGGASDPSSSSPDGAGELRAAALGDEPARDTLPSASSRGFYAAPVGRELVYELSARSTAKLELAAEGEVVEESIEHRVEGRMELVVAARDDDEIVAVVRFPDAVIEATAGAKTERDLDLERAVALPCEVRLRDTGELLGFRFDDAVAPAARNWVRAQVAAFRFEVDGTGARTWEREEADPTGTASVRYFRESEDADETLRLAKTKLAYAPVAAGGSAVPVEVKPEVRGGASAVLGRTLAWLESARFEESLVVPVAGLGLTTRVASSGSLRLVEQGWRPVDSLPQVAWDEPWGSVSGAEDVAAMSSDVEATLSAKRLEGKTLEGLLAEIDVLANAEPTDVAKLMDARHDLAELLRAQPEAVATLAELVGSLNPAAADVALGAAGAAGTEPAQRLLADVLEDRSKPDTLRQSSLDAMFQLTRPTAESYAAVDAVVSDRTQGAGLRSNGMLVLGALASMEPAAGGGDRAAHVERLVALEGDARTDQRLEHWLHALGNTGDTRVLPAARPYLEGSDARLRQAAAEALRGVDGADAVDALARRALSDEDARVRRTCAGILAGRSDEAASKAIGRLLESEPAVEVRRAAVDALARRSATDERARALLAFVAAHDASAELRGRAAGAK